MTPYLRLIATIEGTGYMPPDEVSNVIGALFMRQCTGGWNAEELRTIISDRIFEEAGK